MINKNYEMGGLNMGIRALDLGLDRKSLIATPCGSELLYHLRLVKGTKNNLVRDVIAEDVIDTDDCKVYLKGQHIFTTSTYELTKLMKAANFKTMTLTTVDTTNGIYYAAIPESVLVKEFVGILTDNGGRPVAFIQQSGDTLWANFGQRLIQLDDKPVSNMRKFNAQEAVKFMTKNNKQFAGLSDKVFFF